MHIEFDAGELSSKQARALIALLLSLHPDANPEELTVSVGNISVSGHAPAVTNVLNQTEPVVMTVAEVQADPNRVFAAPTPQAPAAPPAPQPPAASAAPAPPPSAGPVGDRDSKGLSWDERIHSSSKAVNADGSWRSKRGVSNDEIKRVTAELQGAGAPPVPQPPSAAPAPPPQAAPAPVEASSTPGPSAAPSAPPSDRDTFPSLLQRITGGQNASPPTLTVARTNELVTGLGLQFLRDFMTNPGLIPSMNALLDSEGVA